MYDLYTKDYLKKKIEIEANKIPCETPSDYEAGFLGALKWMNKLLDELK